MAKTIKDLQAGDTAYLFRPWRDVGISEITIVNIEEHEFSVRYTYESNDGKDDLTYFSFPNREYNIREDVVFEYDMDVIGVSRDAIVNFIKGKGLCDLIAQKRNIEKKNTQLYARHRYRDGGKGGYVKKSVNQRTDGF